MATCTEVLAEFALKQTIESLPHSVLEKAKLLILDGVGLALAAAREDFARKTMKAVQVFGQGTEARRRPDCGGNIEKAYSLGIPKQ
jgi:2-methylcitrate dehydratase PrpD